MYISARKVKGRVPRDEEPPTIYPQQGPTGVRKRTLGEPKINRSGVQQPFKLPPSLLSQYPALEQMQQPQQMSGTYRPMAQMQQLSGNYRNFEGTSSANGGQANSRLYDLVPQIQAPYQRQTCDIHSQNARTSQRQVTDRTFEAREPVNNVDASRMSEEVHYHLANKSQSVRSQFGARLPPPYEPSNPEQTVGSEHLAPAPSLHQWQGDFRGGTPDSSLPSSESPFVLTPQMECSFSKDSKPDMLDNFDFDAFLKEEPKDDFGHDAFLRERIAELTGPENVPRNESRFIPTPQMEPTFDEVD